MKIEMLERRALLSVSFNPSTGLFTVSASTTGDVTTISQSGNTLTAVDAKVKYTYSASTIKSIKVSVGSGNDSVTIANTVTAPATVTGGSGKDTLVGGGGATVLVAGSGSDSLTCGSGPSTVMVGGGPETLVGGSGLDTFDFGAASVTPLVSPVPIGYVISPGSGVTTLSFVGTPSTVSVNVDLTNDLAVATFAGRTVMTAKMGQAAQITRVIGGAGDDSFTANSANDLLMGGTGSNTLTAGSGNDTLSGGGASTDFIFSPRSSPVNYTLNQSVAGTNQLNFQALPAGDDLTLNLLEDVMATYDNVTISDGKAGQFVNFNQILDGQGDDLITFNNKGDSMFGGGGADTIFGGTGADLIFPGSGYDVVSGGGGADTIESFSGDDVIYATNYLSDPSLVSPAVAALGATHLTKPAVTPVGVQIYAFGSGPASIVGSAGNDTLEGNGADTIHGMGGDDDIIAGGSGEPSVIFGDGGNDTITVGGGDTTVVGGGGTDSITAGTSGGANDFIDNNIPDNSSTSSGAAVIDAAALTANAIAAAQGLATPTYPLLGTPGNGSLIAGKSANMTVIGGLGDDTLEGGDGPATIVGGSGNELLVAGYGNDVVQGGAGDDTIVAGFGPDLLQGGQGNTTFFNVNGFADTVIGGAGENVAQQDPTGLSTISSNVQYVYQPGFVAAPPAPPASAFSASAAAAPGAKPAVAPAPIPVPSVVNGVLTVGSKTTAVGENIAVSEAGNIITATVIGLGVFPFNAGTITSAIVNGGSGDDTISLNTLLVPATVNAGNGNNSVVGGTGNETLIGGANRDTLIGGPGNNLIEGGNGTNSLYGGTGNDTIIGGSGFDNIYPGGFGISVPNDEEVDSIKGGTGDENLYMNNNADALSVRLDLGTITDLVTNTVTHVSGIRNFFAGPGSAVIVSPRVKFFGVNGGSGNTTIFGLGPGATLFGGFGQQTIYADSTGAVIDLIDAPAGSTAYYGKLNDTDSLDGSSGENIVRLTLAYPT
jgi:Ca2+-binding RTX toxin-like protein